MKRGLTDIIDVKRGSTQINKIIRGTTLIWEKVVDSLLLDVFPNPLLAVSEYNIGETSQTLEARRVLDGVLREFDTVNIETETENFVGAGDGEINKLYDKSPNALVGIAGVRPKVVVSGVYNSFVFEGSNVNNMINFGNRQGTPLSDPSLATNGITMFCRVTTDNTSLGYLFSTGAQTGSRGLMMAFSGGTMRVWVHDGTRRYGLSIPATVGVKADFAAVFDNTNKILKGYKDGSFISEDLVGSSDVQSDNEPLVTIGVPNNSLTRFGYDGKLHSLFVWDEVYTDNQIQEISNFI